VPQRFFTHSQAASRERTPFVNPGIDRFARDSPLEESGFEPLVPLATEMLIELARGISKTMLV
jgi:hypothetical protein